MGVWRVGWGDIFGGFCSLSLFLFFFFFFFPFLLLFSTSSFEVAGIEVLALAVVGTSIDRVRWLVRG